DAARAGADVEHPGAGGQARLLGVGDDAGVQPAAQASGVPLVPLGMGERVNHDGLLRDVGFITEQRVRLRSDGQRTMSRRRPEPNGSAGSAGNEVTSWTSWIGGSGGPGARCR